MPFWSTVASMAATIQQRQIAANYATWASGQGVILAGQQDPSLYQRAYTTVVSGFKDFAGKIWDSAINIALREGAYRANAAMTNVVPSAEYVWQCYFSQAISPDDASWLLAWNGIHWEPPGTRMRDTAVGRAWRQADIMLRPRPSVGAYLDFWRQDLISDIGLRDRLKIEGYGQREIDCLMAQRWRPGVPEAMALHDAGIIGANDVRESCQYAGIKDSRIVDWYSDNVRPLPLDTAIAWYRTNQGISRERLETTFAQHGLADGYYRDLILTNSPVWAPSDAYRMRRLGMVDDIFLENHLKAAGYVSDADRAKWWANYRYYPGVGDLVAFSVREVWNEPVVRRWQYDAERPAAFDFWMGVSGADWGHPTPTPQGDVTVSWPAAHWRAHWQTFPLGFAYQSYNKFRPERIGRYRDRFPNIQPFTFDHLTDVIKIHDYPPAARDWLAALHAPVMPIMSVRQMFRYGLRDREWARGHLMDRGYLQADADDLLDLLAADDQIAIRRAAQAEQKSITRQIVTELRAAYRMGGMDAQAVSSRLAGMGWSTRQIQRLLALEDARGARERLAVFLRQLRRSYLSGALADSEAAGALAAAQISQPAIRNYLLLWRSELGVERRSLSSQQIVAAVAAGALTPALAAVRLSRLGWTQPDLALLLQEASAKLTRAQASAANQAANRAARQGKALLAAQRQAVAAARSAQAQLRRIYPLATLKRQFCLGIRKGQTVSALLLSQGYTPDSISALLKQWTIECEESPPAAEKVAVAGAAYARRQTPISIVKQWWQNGIVTDAWARARLAAIGVEPSAIPPTIQLWQSTLGKKSGPSQTATPQTQPQL